MALALSRRFGAGLASAALFALALVSGCASLPPGSDYPKSASVALTRSEQTRMGRDLAAAKAAHPGKSGFKLIPTGIEGFILRMQMAQAAEHTLDVQYFLIQSDNTGQLLIEALIAAADRGVRVRVLLDDAGSFGRDAQVRALAGFPNVELRVFNPFAYRGELELLHLAEYAGDAARLTYRMHNKLFVADNEIGVVGGRNIGDEYFQGGGEVEFGDYDVVSAGPVVDEISRTFDSFWNSPLAIPIEALAGGKPSAEDGNEYRRVLAAHRAQLSQAEVPYLRALATGEPLASILVAEGSLVWARAEVVYDSPEKAKADDGEQGGRLLRKRLGEVARQVRSELIIVSPYLVPGPGGMKFFEALRERSVSVRILTNSLAATDVPIVHSSYQAFREPLLGHGVELYEVRQVLGRPVVRGHRLRRGSGGLYALHAKAFVFDRERLFIGSMNLDQRSLRLNTEIGLIIDSPELARQVAQRVDDIAQPANSYVLALGDADALGARSLVWRTLENGAPVEFHEEPAASFWKRLQVRLYSLLPLDSLL
jgi:putative cardiolipin synthase